MNCEVASARRLRRNDYDTTRHDTKPTFVSSSSHTPHHAGTHAHSTSHTITQVTVESMALCVPSCRRSVRSHPHQPTAHPPSRSTSWHNRISRCCCGRWPCRRGIAGNGAVGGSAGGGSVGGGRWQFRRWQCMRDGIAVGGSVVGGYAGVGADEAWAEVVSL